MRFITPVYHPNIDSEGRICLNLLKMPPKGCWAPSYSIAAVLAAVQILLSQPNPDDPLMTDITEEYRSDLNRFLRRAREHTLKYASEHTFEMTAESTTAEPVPAKRPRSQQPEQEAKEEQAEKAAAEQLSQPDSQSDLVHCPVVEPKCVFKKIKL